MPAAQTFDLTEVRETQRTMVRSLLSMMRLGTIVLLVGAVGLLLEVSARVAPEGLDSTVGSEGLIVVAIVGARWVATPALSRWGSETGPRGLR